MYSTYKTTLNTPHHYVYHNTNTKFPQLRAMLFEMLN